MINERLFVTYHKIRRRKNVFRVPYSVIPFAYIIVLPEYIGNRRDEGTPSTIYTV